jgi:hypothetical protein
VETRKAAAIVSSPWPLSRHIGALPRRLWRAPVARLEDHHFTAVLDKKAATPAAANNLRRVLRAIMKLAKKRKMIAVNPMTEVEPIRYKVKGFKD